jgi:N utilization substance protein B
MGKRREGREAAVQYLYQIDLSGETPVNADSFWALRSGPGKPPVAAKTRTFTEQLAQGVLKHLEEIDGYIK